MKAVSNDFKSAIKQMGRQIDAKVTYTLNNEEIELGVNQLNSVTPHYEGGILKSVMKQLDLDSNVDIPLGTILEAQFGVLVNNQYEYISLGQYVVYSSEKQEDLGSYKIVCYDKMLYSMKDYETFTYFPTNVREYIDALCDHIGLVFANSSEVFPNYEKEIPNELYLDANGESLNYTFRDVLDQLAQVTASTICINDDGELELRYITDTEEEIDEDSLKDINVNFGEKYGAINTIVFSRSADADSIHYPDPLPANPVEIKISDNQILNGDNRADFFEDIYDVLNGLEYYINDFTSTGITYLDLCDRYDVKIGSNTYSCVMLNDEINITQGLVENVHTDLPKESVTDYNTTTKDDRTQNRTTLIVDKVNQRITSEISSMDDIRTIVIGTYTITDDTTFQSGKTYYILDGDTYEEYTNYTPGDAVPEGIIYELTGSIDDKLTTSTNDLQRQINNNKTDIGTLRQQTSTKFEQTTTDFQFSITTLTGNVNDNKTDADNKFADIQHFIRYDKQYTLTTDTTYQANKVYYVQSGGTYAIATGYSIGDSIPANTIYEERGTITIGVSNSDIVLKQRNDRIYFEQNGNEVAYISNNTLYITDGRFLNQLRIGNFAFIPRTDGNGNFTSLSFRKVA